MPRIAEPSAPKYAATPAGPEPGFAEVVGIIRQARALWTCPRTTARATCTAGSWRTCGASCSTSAADLGQLEFYLEALDRDVRQAHERPSIGVLLCASKDAKVVEHALARSASPALVAEYVAQLPSSELLEAQLARYTAAADDTRGEENA